MLDMMQTLHQFWSGFGLTAYDENTVPDNAVLPYLTYEASSDFFGSDLQQAAALWYRSNSWKAITEKEQEISKVIGRGGVVLPCEGGAIWIKRGTPWAQRMYDSNDATIRRIALNYEIEFLL